MRRHTTAIVGQSFPTAEFVNAMQDAVVFVCRAQVAILVGIALLIVLTLAGCAAPTAAARSRAPERAAPGEASRPCLTTLPTRARLAAIADPEKMAFIDEKGEPQVAMRITVEVVSAQAFFNYVESLEGIARKALGCVVR